MNVTSQECLNPSPQVKIKHSEHNNTILHSSKEFRTQVKKPNTKKRATRCTKAPTYAGQKAEHSGLKKSLLLTLQHPLLSDHLVKNPLPPPL